MDHRPRACGRGPGPPLRMSGCRRGQLPFATDQDCRSVSRRRSKRHRGQKILAEPLSRELGQRVLVENRAGGSGMIGTEATIRGEHDGYTLLVGGLATMVLLPAAKPGHYDPLKDVVPLSQIWYSPQVLAARGSLRFRSAADLVSYAKANPGGLNFGSAGNGTVTHLAILLLAKEARINITHVPYRSTALWLNDAMAERIDGGFGDVKTLLPHIETKAITPLAVTVSERAPQLPDIPTVGEVGLPEVQTETRHQPILGV